MHSRLAGWLSNVEPRTQPLRSVARQHRCRVSRSRPRCPGGRHFARL